MLGKNNYKEKYRRIERQSKQDHFSIRKFSIGAASVLLGFTFLGFNSQTAKADTVHPNQEISKSANEKSAQSSLNGSGRKTEIQNTQSKTTIKKSPKLSNYAGLTSFLKNDDLTNIIKEKKSVNSNKLVETQSKTNESNSVVSSANNPAIDHNESNQGNAVVPTDSEKGNSTEITGSADKNEEAAKPDNSVITHTKPDDTTENVDKSKDIDQSQKIQSKTDGNLQEGFVPTIKNGVAYVYNWDQFVTAFKLDQNYLPKNSKISEIDIMKDIVSHSTGSEDNFDFSGRKLLIQSGDDKKHIIDFKGFHPNLTGKNQLDITYRNLQIWSSDFYGIVKTNSYSYDTSIDNKAIITLDNIDFHGSQMLYVGDHNEIHLKNKITAETVSNDYKSPVDGSQAHGGGNNQQLFEFTGAYNDLIFDKGCEFTGSTFGGNVIQMSGNNCNVIVQENAIVTLNPLLNADGSRDANSGEGTDGVAHGIYLSNSGTVDIKGTLNINVGNNIKIPYNGSVNKAQAKAIRLESGSKFNIESGGSVNIQSNGNIASGGGNNNLVYDAGSLIVNPEGSLKIIGQNMGNYTGTLVSVTGKADIENGSFIIQLTDNAGTGAITLINATGNLIVNNPKSLVLDAHLNKVSGTSIIGDNQLTITNVRQKIQADFDSNLDLTLPPYHVLKIKKDKTGNITVDPGNIEVLNGKKLFTMDAYSSLLQDPELRELNGKLPVQVKSILSTISSRNVNNTYDDVFREIMNFVFKSPETEGYNNLSFIPANPSGFLDIDPADVKADYNEDGTIAISGSMMNYTDENDGLTSDGKFRKVLPGGTSAYIKAVIQDLAGVQTVIQPNAETDDPIDDPYQFTNDSENNLSHKFTACADFNKDTGRYEFSFKIPANQVSKLVKGYKIELTPHANFIEYNPLSLTLPVSDSNHRPVSVDVLSIVQDTAAKTINDKLKEISDAHLTVPNADLNKAIENAKVVAAKPDTNSYDSDKSVYGADDIGTVEKRKKDALNDLIKVFNKAKEESDAINTQLSGSDKVITDAAKAAETRIGKSGLSYDEQQNYITAIENAKNDALAKKGDANYDATKSIYGSEKVADIITKQTKVTNIFNKEAAKGEIDGFTKECETSLGLTTSDNSNVESAKANAIANIDKLVDSATPIVDNAEAVKVSEDTGKSDILSAAKDIARTQLENSKTSVKADIDKIDGLSSEEKENYKAQAETIVKKEDKSGYGDLIDQDLTANDISTHLSEGITALNQLKTQAQDLSARNKAINRIIDAQNDASKLIDQISGLSDTQRQNYKDQVNSFVEEGKKAVREAKNEDIDATAQNYIEQIKSIPNAAKEDLLANLRQEAKTAVETAASKAQQDISEIPDKLIDQNGKTKYNNQIIAAKNAAETAIAAADTAELINSAKGNGINNINEIVKDASLAKEKSIAAKDLTDTKNKDLEIVNAAHDNGSVDDQKWQDAVSKINNTYNDVILKITTKDVSIDEVDDDKDNAIREMNKIANEIKGDAAAQELAQAKSDAISNLSKLAEEIKNSIVQDKNLSQIEKDGYAARVDSILADAKNVVNSATSKEEVTKQEQIYEPKINQIETDASLKSAEENGLQKIQEAKNNALNQVAKLTNVDSDTKNQLNSEINNAYDAAKNKIENPDPATVDQVSENIAEGVININNVVSDLNIAKIANTRKLNQYAEKAIDQINANTDLSLADKKNATQAVRSASDNGLINIKNATSTTLVEKAEKAAETAIDAVTKTSPGLDEKKQQAKDTLDSTAREAKAELKSIYDDLTADFNKLTDDQKVIEKADYDKASKAYESATRDGGTIDQTCETAKENVDNAQNKDEVDKAYTEGNSNILSQEAAASLTITKSQAKQNIQKAVDNAKAELKGSNNEINPSDQNAVDEVQKLGDSNIDAETDAGTISTIETNTINGIKNIVKNAKVINADQIRTDRDNAIKKLDKELSNVKEAIDALKDDSGKTGLALNEINKFKDQAQKAHDEAVVAVSGATGDQIETQKKNGIDAINKALADANLQVAKNKAKSDLDDFAESAKNKVKDPKDKENIDQDKNAAQGKIDLAKNEADVNEAVQEGKNAINGIVTSATKPELIADKTEAKNYLSNKANNLKTDIDNAFANKKIDASQQKALKGNVDDVLSKAMEVIETAEDVNAINKAKSKGESDLDKIQDELRLDQVLNAALAELQTAADNANQTAENVAKQIAASPEEENTIVNDLKDQIEAERSNYAENIEKAIKDSNPDAAIKKATNAGIEAISKLISRYTDKAKEISKIKQHAEEVRAKLQNPNLDASEIDQGEKAITAALQTGINNVYQAKDTDDLSSIEEDGEKAIDRAELPSELLAEQNKQFKAIEDYVKSQGDIDSVAKDLPSEQKQKLRDEVNDAVQKAKDKIKAVTLPQLPENTDLKAAITKVDNAEKGIPENGETADFGEAEINRLYDVAKNKQAIYQVKKDAIKQLEAKKNAAVQTVESSGMSEDDQLKAKQKIENTLNEATNKIKAIPESDSDGKDRTASEVKADADKIIADASKGFLDTNGNKVPGFDEITSESELEGAKTKAKKILNNKQTDANKIIDNSQLTTAQKVAAKQKVNDAYNAARDQIDKESDANKIPTDKVEIGKNIDRVTTELSDSTAEDKLWVEHDRTNALTGAEDIDGLQKLADKLTEVERSNKANADYIKNIDGSLTAIKNAKSMTDISVAYDKGMTALNKLKGKETIDDALDKAEKEIMGNQDLDQARKDELIQNAKNHAAEGKQNIDNVADIGGDIIAKKNQIDQAINKAVSDILSEIDNANKISKLKADQELANKHKEVVDKIKDEYGVDADTTNVDKAWENHKHTSGNTYNEIQQDKINAEKEIAKGAVEDAANNAKNKVDKNEVKKPNGTDYNDQEKQKIKDEIDKDKDKAKNEIDKSIGKKDPSTGKSDIDDARDNGTDKIHKDVTDPETIDNITNSGNSGNNGNSGDSSNGNIANNDNAANKKPEIDGSNLSNSTEEPIDVDLNISEEVKLMHNAYIYDAKGKRANLVTLGAGSVITTHGIKNIAGRDFYIVVDPGKDNNIYFIAVANAKAAQLKLKHNSYVYNMHGKRVKNAGLLKKGVFVNTYGSAVKICGKKYYIIDSNRYIKAVNVAVKSNSARTFAAELLTTSLPMNNNKTQKVVEKYIIHNSYLYNEKGKRANKLIILGGSTVNTTSQKMINGKLYYELDDKLYISVSNIDGNNKKLNHNAFIFNQHGKRIGKKVLKKQKRVKTYGEAVRINHKNFYLVDKNRYVKKGNF